MLEFKLKGNIETDIASLRQAYPGFYFEEAEQGFIVARKSLQQQSYGDWKKLDDGRSYRIATTFDISAFEKLPHLTKYEVLLTSGKTIKLLPATAQPRRIVFGKPQDTNAVDQSTLLGKLAFSYYERLKVNDPNDAIKFDNEFLKFIELILISSYSLPIEVINEIGFSDSDLEPMFLAALGIDQKKT